MWTQGKCENVDEVLGEEKMSCSSLIFVMFESFYVASKSCTGLRDTNV